MFRQTRGDEQTGEVVVMVAISLCLTRRCSRPAHVYRMDFGIVDPRKCAGQIHSDGAEYCALFFSYRHRPHPTADAAGAAFARVAAGWNRIRDRLPKAR